MTLTDTVSTFAQEAVSTASELGSQALGLGSKAAELGSDAVSTMASAAEHIADSLSKKVKPAPKRHTMRWIVIGGVAVAGGAVVFAKSRRRSASVMPAPQETRADDATPVSLLS